MKYRVMFNQDNDSPTEVEADSKEDVIAMFSAHHITSIDEYDPENDKWIFNVCETCGRKVYRCDAIKDRAYGFHLSMSWDLCLDTAFECEGCWAKQGPAVKKSAPVPRSRR